jgi:hypothetical protein
MPPRYDTYAVLALPLRTLLLCPPDAPSEERTKRDCGHHHDEVRERVRRDGHQEGRGGGRELTYNNGLGFAVESELESVDLPKLQHIREEGSAMNESLGDRARRFHLIGSGDDLGYRRVLGSSCSGDSLGACPGPARRPYHFLGAPQIRYALRGANRAPPHWSLTSSSLSLCFVLASLRMGFTNDAHADAGIIRRSCAVSLVGVRPHPHPRFS